MLALAIARELVAQDALDREFLAAHAEGVDAFLAAADEWTLARAEAVTGVGAAVIVRLAGLLADVRPAYFRVGWGLERTRNGGSACAAVFALPVLTGQFGVPGSGVYASTSDGIDLGVRPVPTPDPPRVLNMNHLGRYLTDPLVDPPVRVLVVIGANPAVSHPEQQLVLEGLARDDVFTVVHEQVMTDTARFADVVLPATTHFEVDDVTRSYGSFTRHVMPAVIERVWCDRTNNEFAGALAARLGLDAALFPTDPRVLADSFDASGVTRSRPEGGTVQFRDTRPDGGRARLAGLDEIDVPRVPALVSDYPLALISPASPRTINSMFGEFQGPDPVLRMHSQDAAARARRRRRDPRLQRSGRADHHAHRRRRPPPGRGLDAERPLAARLARRADGQRLRPRHAVGPGRRRVLRTTRGSTSRLSNLGAWPPGTGSRKPRMAPSSW